MSELVTEDDRSPSPPAWDVVTRPHQEVVQSLLDGETAVEIAAPKLAAIAVPDPNIDRDECEEHIGVLWIVLFDTLLDDPDRAQILAELVHCISRLPPALKASGEQLTIDESGLRVWNDLPVLGWNLCDEWNVEIPLSSEERRQKNINRFVAINAFVAFMLTYGGTCLNYHDLALSTLSFALEYPDPNETETGPTTQHLGDRWNCHILASAKVVEIAGRLIHSWECELEFGEGEGGPLWNGKHGFGKERWLYWQRRFASLGHDFEGLQLSEEARRSAGKASETMWMISNQ